MFNTTIESEDNNFSLKNLPEGWFVQINDDEDKYLGRKTDDGKYLVRINTNGYVFVTDLPITHSRVKVTPVSVQFKTL